MRTRNAASIGAASRRLATNMAVLVLITPLVSRPIVGIVPDGNAS